MLCGKPYLSSHTSSVLANEISASPPPLRPALSCALLRSPALSCALLRSPALACFSTLSALPSPFRHTSMKGGGIIQNTAGEGILNVFVCARINMQRREMFPDKKVDDLTPEEKDSTFNADSSKFVVYMSAESHFSGTRVTDIERGVGTQLELVLQAHSSDTR